ncbi:MAG TPA: FAD binding domain-containing protein [Streptosporangiaceae bacterium]
MSVSPSVVFPASEPDVIFELRCEEDETVRPLAGGTALALLARYGFLQPTRLVSLRNLREKLGQISSPQPGALRIGAMVTLTELARSPLVWASADALAAAAGLVANVRVRNVACLGGHLAHADPHMDLPPVLLALDASVEISGPDGVRWSSIDDLVSGYYQTTLGQQELITAVEVPVAAGRRAAYCRYTSAAADDWPSVTVAVAIEARDGRVAEPRIAVGAVTTSPLRLRAAEALLDGVVLDDASRLEAACKEAADAAGETVRPVSDVHGSAAYKREMLRVHAMRALASLFARPGSEDVR